MRPGGEEVGGCSKGLGDRIQGVFEELRGEGRLTDYHLETALRQIRLSLLEADVALPVVRQFTARVREKRSGPGSPASVARSGGHARRARRVDRSSRRAAADVDRRASAVLALVGLQGSGKTTSAGELALHLKSRGSTRCSSRPILRGGGAVSQLQTSGPDRIPSSIRLAQAVPVAVAGTWACRGGADRPRHGYREAGGPAHGDEELMRQVPVAIVDAIETEEASSSPSDTGTTRCVPRGSRPCCPDGNRSDDDDDARGGAALTVVTTQDRPISSWRRREGGSLSPSFRPHGLAHLGSETC